MNVDVSTMSTTACFGNVAKKTDFIFDLLRKALFAAAEDHIGHQADLAQDLHGVLRRFGLDLASGFEEGDIGKV